jgi:ABC-2 type transport system ATP-binding protein
MKGCNKPKYHEIYIVNHRFIMETVPVINIESLTKRFGNFTAVDHISFGVDRGEIFGFLGPNGAGKTTTIRMVLDLLRPDSGKISLFGINLKESSFEIRKRCGYLPGNFNAYGNLTGMEFLRLCSDLREQQFKMDQVLPERLGFDRQLMNRKIKALSHGTLQKLGIIQAFYHNPELLILDEPTIGLDPLMQEEFYLLLKEHQEKGSTIFLSSHNLAEVERICHRVAIIRNGKLVAVDSVANLRKTLKRRLRFTLSHAVGGVSLPDSELVHQEDKTYEFIIHGDIRAILKSLSDLPVIMVTMPEPALEEIFIQYYKDRGDD